MVDLVLEVPAEVLLYILTYLDLPDLEALAKAFPKLANLAADPGLHRQRIRVVAPSRVEHSLFATGPHGTTLRPSVLDLINRDVIRGLGIARRWRMGLYFYSKNSIVQYENSLRLARRHASDVVSYQLRSRPSSRSQFSTGLHISHVLPDVESSSPAVSTKLLPVIRKLKWSLQRDKLSQLVREGLYRTSNGSLNPSPALWLERHGPKLIMDTERVRLAICPDIRKTVDFYEALANGTSTQ